MPRKIKGLLIVILLQFSSWTMAQNENHLYIGLGWTVKHGWVPSAIIGARSMDVDARSDVVGIDLSLAYHLRDGLDQLLVKMARGEVDWQAEVGGGYNFQSSSWLLTGGVQGRIINYSLNITDSGEVDGGVAFNTIDKYRVD